MALFSLRALGALTRQQPGAAVALPSRLLNACAGYATDATALSKKDVVALLDQRDDPEADAAVRAYLRAAYTGGAKLAVPAAGEELELVAKVERKYHAAQVVEYGIQNVSVPLAWDKESTNAPLKRFVAQLVDLGTQAGFESPATEIEKRLAEASATAETVREVLTRAAPYSSPDYHAALLEALAAVEAETSSTVLLDGASAGYKKFTDKVKSLATARRIPWQALLDAKKVTLPEDALAAAKTVAGSWAQSAAIADVSAELEVIKAEAAMRLDKHLSKTVEQVRSEQAAALVALQRKIDSAKGAAWALQYQKDLQYVKWFDASVAADPASGPSASA